MSRWRMAGAAMSLAAMLGGCVTSRDKMLAYNENVPNLDQKKVAAFIKDQNDIYNTLATIEPVLKDDYRPIVNAGMMYVDMRCARYMDALFWFNRAKEGANRQIGFAGAASSAVLEILKASRELVALAPIGFKFASETIDGVGKGLLYDISPGAVRSIVEEQQSAFKKAIEGASYTTKTAALQTVQSYVMLCLPASVEGQVELAVKDASFREKKAPDSEPNKGADKGTREKEVSKSDKAAGDTGAAPKPESTSGKPADAAGTGRGDLMKNKVPILEMVRSR